MSVDSKYRSPHLGAREVLGIIADNLSKAGWSGAASQRLISNGRTIFVADAHRDDGKRFVVRADEKLDGVCGTRIGDLRLRRIGLKINI